MDIARPDISRKKRRQRLLTLVVGVAVLAAITVGLGRLEPAAPSVDKATIWAESVKRGPMVRAVRGNGKLVPNEIRWITASSPGRIEKIPLLPGVTVEPDTVLVELSNPDLEQAMYDAEALLQAGVAQMEKLQAQMESEQLAQESKIASLKSDLALAEIEAKANEELFEQGFVSLLVARRASAIAEELRSRLNFEERQVALKKKSADVQIATQTTEIANLRKQLELKQRRHEALKVTARMNGVLQRLGDTQPLRIGQQLGAGATIARIADPSRLKAEIKIPETQAKDIQQGQAALIDTRNGVIPGHVVRIDPAVQNGTVMVDVALDGPLPKGARPDLSVDGTITLERLEDVLYVGRPADGQADARMSLFKITEDGRGAIRVPVELGRISVSTVEVREGLQVGDQVILSDMSQWDDHDRIKLN